MIIAEFGTVRDPLYSVPFEDVINRMVNDSVSLYVVTY